MGVPPVLIVIGILIVGVGFWFAIIWPMQKARALERKLPKVDPIPEELENRATPTPPDSGKNSHTY